MKQTWLKKLIVVVAPLVGVALLMNGCVPLGGRSTRPSAFRNTPAEDAQLYCESVIQKPMNTGLRREIANTGASGSVLSLLGPAGKLLAIGTYAVMTDSANKDENWYNEEMHRCIYQQMDGRYARY